MVVFPKLQIYLRFKQTNQQITQNMKNAKKIKKENTKFDLDKMEVAKLKNLHLIVGGNKDDITVTKTIDSDSQTF